MGKLNRKPFGIPGMMIHLIKLSQEKCTWSTSSRQSSFIPLIQTRFPARNLTIVGFNSRDGYYYPGFIEASTDPRLCKVTFFTIQSAELHHDQVIVVGGATPHPYLRELDHVLVLIREKCTRVEYYVPGTVLLSPKHHRYQTKRYTVQLYNGKKVSRSRSELIKIGPDRYNNMLGYLSELHRGTFVNQLTLVPPPTPGKSSTPKGSLESIPKVEESIKSPVVEETTLNTTGSDDPDVHVTPIPSSETDDTDYFSMAIQTDRIRTKQTDTQTDSLQTRQTETNTDEIKRHVRSVQTELTLTDIEEKVTSSPVLDKEEEDKLSGVEVLARWSDDGWYYAGYVVSKSDGDNYVVSDITGHTEIIARTDIIDYEDHRYDQIQTRDRVIAQHPDYPFSFAPGVVRKVFGTSHCQIRLYDRTVSEVSSKDVYTVSKSIHDACAEYILGIEAQLQGKTMLVRNDSTGYYKWRMVEKVENYHMCCIKWTDNGSAATQKIHHCFEVGKGTKHRKWDHVLAPFNRSMSVYLPGQIVGPVNETVTVKFCVGKKFSKIRLDDCVWLNEDYFKNAVGFFRHVNKNKHPDDNDDELPDLQECYRTQGAIKTNSDPMITSGGVRFNQLTLMSSR